MPTMWRHFTPDVRCYLSGLNWSWNHVGLLTLLTPRDQAPCLPGETLRFWWKGYPRCWHTRGTLYIGSTPSGIAGIASDDFLLQSCNDVLSLLVSFCSFNSEPGLKVLCQYIMIIAGSLNRWTRGDCTSVKIKEIWPVFALNCLFLAKSGKRYPAGFTRKMYTPTLTGKKFAEPYP